MSAALWSGALRAIFFMWVALTLWVIWYRVGLYLPELHHQYFGRWILCGILNDTPLVRRLGVRLPMRADGAWYSLPSFAQWLDGPQMYRDTFYSWYWHMATGLGGYYGLGTDLFPIGIGALFTGWRLRREPDSKDHLRGLRLVSPRQHNREMHGGIVKRALHGQPRGIRLGSSIIPERHECEHFLITGSPGAGKSTAMRQMLSQIVERGQSAIVIDPESEYVQQFYDEERGDVVLNPLDARCPYWSPWSELREEWFTVDAAAIAASLVRGKRKRD